MCLHVAVLPTPLRSFVVQPPRLCTCAAAVPAVGPAPCQEWHALGSPQMNASLLSSAHTYLLAAGWLETGRLLGVPPLLAPASGGTSRTCADTNLSEQHQQILCKDALSCSSCGVAVHSCAGIPRHTVWMGVSADVAGQICRLVCNRGQSVGFGAQGPGCRIAGGPASTEAGVSARVPASLSKASRLQGTLRQ